MKRILRVAFRVIYALWLTSMVGCWLINEAFLERGYHAMGGEMLLIPFVFFGAYKLAELFFRESEDAEDESNEAEDGGEPWVQIQ